MRLPQQAARQADVDQRLHGVDAVRVLREAHRPHEHRIGPRHQQVGELGDPLAGHAAVGHDAVPADLRRPGACLVEAGCARANESLVDAAAIDQRQQHAEQERQVPSGVHLEPVVGDRRAAQRALGNRRNPVALEPRLAKRVHDGDLRAVALGVMQVLGRHRLVVGDVRSEQHDEVGVKPVGIAARGGRMAQRRLHRHGRRGVTEARGVVDVVRPEEPRGLLRGVVHLVGDAAAGQVERHPLRVDGSRLVRDAVQGVVPAHHAEAAFARAPQHRLGQAAQRAQLA